MSHPGNSRRAPAFKNSSYGCCVLRILPKFIIQNVVDILFFVKNIKMKLLQMEQSCLTINFLLLNYPLLVR